jgi:hypothetical protein
MKKKEHDALKKLDFSFLPRYLAKERECKIGKALSGLKKIKWPIGAVVLGGGYRYKEITFTQKKVSSDIDLFVFSNFIPFFWKKLLKIQEEINQPVHFFHYRGVVPLFLRKSKTFWAYRLKQEGIILQGDRGILKKIRARENNIPETEAIRILFQTLVVWIVLHETKHREQPHKDNLFTVLRAYLNIGESYLTFFGYLKPSYEERRQEFQKRFKEFGIRQDLAKKIDQGYLSKAKVEQVQKEYKDEISLSKAKQDCFKAIDSLLSLYLQSEDSLEEKLDILGEKYGPNVFFNFIFYLELRKIKELRPRFLLIFKLRAVDLWKMAVYMEKGKKEELFNLLKKYFKVQNFSEKTLVKLFEAYPIPTTMELF